MHAQYHVVRFECYFGIRILNVYADIQIYRIFVAALNFTQLNNCTTKAPFRIRINLNRILVNALIQIVNRFTQPTSGCGLSPVETGLVLKEVRVNSWCGF